MITTEADLPIIEAVAAGIHAANQIGHRVANRAEWNPQPDGSIALVAVCQACHCKAIVAVTRGVFGVQFIDGGMFTACGEEGQ